MSGSILAAHSFGDPSATYGRARLTLGGSIGGVPLGPHEVSVVSTTVIPTQGNIDVDATVPLTVQPGQNVLPWSLSGEVELTVTAKSTGFAGTISGAATAAASFPDSIWLGNFRGAGGQDLPPCMSVRDTEGIQYVWTDGTTYCTGKTNSLGCTPAITATGTPSASVGSGFVVTASEVRNNKPGILLYGTGGPLSAPFQGGVLCVRPPVGRTPLVHSGGNAPPADDCSGTWSIDMNAFAAGALGGAPSPALSTIGSRVYCQWWGRDGGASFGASLSDALHYSVCQ